MNVIDLFSGCGGFSLGFEKAGFNVLLGVDVWKDALVTFEKNHNKAKVIEEDLNSISANQLLSFINKDKNEIDIIIGGPPCQGFSISGKRILDDPRNQLYKSFVNIVNDIQPKVFVMENVPGLVRLFGGKAKDGILESLESIGYNVTYKILTAADYGVPQMRKRVFFVGLRKDLFEFPYDYFQFPVPVHGAKLKYPYVTSEEAISDLPLLEDEHGEEHMSYLTPPQNKYQSLMRLRSDVVKNHLATIHKPKTVEIISQVPDGGNYKDLPENLHNTRKVNIAWTRMNSKKPCFTIDTGHNHHFHYKANRVPTVRESARIQSFPDDFIFYGTKTSQLKQVGNAVPPILSYALALEIKKIIES
ncbi:DNA cytosine methyltransferase [Sporosarcina sp. P26b]|uniref:DNA cytosine methyltransferase n=1 Tax=Sporosarcina sp. P26b TaxID=2048253 RepID=UPI001E32A710|nr:DNA cytosine methyltransferase [Sporosarcina sp. P26b]